VRTALNLPPLRWSDKLAEIAQKWADRLAARNEFIHRPKSIYGENMFKIVGVPTSPGRVVKEWAAEAADYDYASNLCKGVCGHYTQIVWRDTKEVGCGIARKGRNEIWVCDYNPPGNWVGKRPY
jgi:pathogenesis-related protein 1